MHLLPLLYLYDFIACFVVLIGVLNPRKERPYHQNAITGIPDFSFQIKVELLNIRILSKQLQPMKCCILHVHGSVTFEMHVMIITQIFPFFNKIHKVIQCILFIKILYKLKNCSIKCGNLKSESSLIKIVYFA